MLIQEVFALDSHAVFSLAARAETTPQDSIALSSHSCTEVYIDNNKECRHAHPDDIREIAFVFCPKFLNQESTICVSGISNAFLTRFEIRACTAPAEFVRFFSPEDSPFVSQFNLDFSPLQDVSRLSFDFLSEIRRQLKVVSQSSTRHGQFQTYRTSSPIAVNPTLWQYLRRRLAYEDDSLTILVDKPVPFSGKVFRKFMSSSATLKFKAPSMWCLVVSRHGLTALERVLGTTALDIVTRKVTLPGCPREVAEANTVVFTYWESQLRIFVFYGEAALVYSSAFGKEMLIDVLNQKSYNSDPPKYSVEQWELLGVTPNAFFVWDEEFFEVTSVDGCVVKAKLLIPAYTTTNKVKDCEPNREPMLVCDSVLGYEQLSRRIRECYTQLMP